MSRDWKDLEDYKKFLEELEKKYFGLAEEHRRRIDLTRGVALGLTYGIIGNLFVQHWYPVFEGLVLGKYETLFGANVVVCGFSLGIILYVTIRFRRQLKEDAFMAKVSKENVETAIRAIERLKEMIEKRKSEQSQPQEK
jgi:tetrahydromethanopterin S-methyltransferase subunit G